MVQSCSGNMLVSACTSLAVILILYSTFSSTFVLGATPCGKLNSQVRGERLTGKIVGGYDVGFYKYPWFAALQIEDDTQCGGALIGNNYVLTAAHCYDSFIGHNKKLEDAFMIKVGLYNNCKKEGTQRVYKTIKVHIHEEYAKKKPYYDIALLQLSDDTSPYMPICLPPKPLADSEQEAEAWIAGFGSMVEGGDAYPCEMREGRVLLFDADTCKAMLKKLTDNPSEYAYTNALCAGYKAGGVDSCQGDSGGPLMTLNQVTNSYRIVGITSFGWGCGEKDAMGIYTDTSKYLDWIEEKSGVKAADEYSPDDNNNAQNDSPITLPTNLSAISDAINSIYDHVMNSQHAPQEIVIRFKNKRRNGYDHRPTAATKRKPRGD